jgi:hypothetical protein
LYTGRAFDCLADFMGTSQDAYGNANGRTKFFAWADGHPMTWSDLLAFGPSVYDQDGMFGIMEYMEYRGYDRNTYLGDLYTQQTDNMGGTYGFTLQDFKLQIDAGRPVIVHISGHTLLGIGYSDSDPNAIHVFDEWTGGQHTMLWTADSLYGDAQLVTVVRLIPEPSSALLVGAGLWLLSLVARKRG